jgi:hypothetical protein
MKMTRNKGVNLALKKCSDVSCLSNKSGGRIVNLYNINWTGTSFWFRNRLK